MAEHQNGCSCGCGGQEGEEDTIITLTLEDDSEMDCIVLAIFPAKGRDYIALIPEESAEAEDGDVYLYRFAETEEGQPHVSNIEDDGEYEAVAEAFDKLLDQMEQEELGQQDAKN